MPLKDGCNSCTKHDVCFYFEKVSDRCKMICCHCGECICVPEVKNKTRKFAQINDHYLLDGDLIVCKRCWDSETDACKKHGEKLVK